MRIVEFCAILFMKYFLIIFCIVFIFAFCQTKSNSQHGKFHVFLPDTTKTRSNETFDNLIDLGKQMNLPKLDTGVSGTDIRLWTTSMIKPDVDTKAKIKDLVVGQKPNGIVAKF